MEEAAPQRTRRHRANLRDSEASNHYHQMTLPKQMEVQPNKTNVQSPRYQSYQEKARKTPWSEGMAVRKRGIDSTMKAVQPPGSVPWGQYHPSNLSLCSRTTAVTPRRV